MFLMVLQFYKLYTAIINHKQVLCLARKNDSLMILQYSYILIIVFIIKGRWCKLKKETGDGDGQHNMASQSLHLQTPISFFFLLRHTDLSFSFSPPPLAAATQRHRSPKRSPAPSKSSHSSVLVVSKSRLSFKKENNLLRVVTLSATAAQRRST